MKTISVQLAIDTMGREAVIRQLIAAKACGIDLIEIGRPLITSLGVSAISLFLQHYPSDRVYADVKCIDFPTFELSPFIEANIGEVTVLATMPDSRLRELRDSDLFIRSKIAVSLMGYPVRQVARRCLDIKKMGYSRFICHGAGVSCSAFAEVLTYLDRLKSITGIHLTAAGGISSKNADQLNDYSVDRVIVGRGITGASDPTRETLKIRSLLNNA